MKTLSLSTQYQTSIIMTKILIAIFLGGGTGSVLRYCVQMALHERIVPYSFPWATFAVNIIGSFLIGLFYVLSARFNLSAEVRILLTTGLCGGFTTFSTFSNDGLILIKPQIRNPTKSQSVAAQTAKNAIFLVWTDFLPCVG